MRIEFTKDSGEGQTRWLIEADGNHVGEITQEREDFASATSRARGTKVVGYAVTFDGGESKWFDANGNARAAFKAAQAHAVSHITEPSRPAMIINLATRNANPDEEREYCDVPGDEGGDFN